MNNQWNVVISYNIILDVSIPREDTKKTNLKVYVRLMTTNCIFVLSKSNWHRHIFFYPNIAFWNTNPRFRFLLHTVTNNCFNLLADLRGTQTVSLLVDTANFLDSYRRGGTWNPWSESESGRLYFMLFVQIIARSLVSLFNANRAPFKFKQF